MNCVQSKHCKTIIDEGEGVFQTPPPLLLLQNIMFVKAVDVFGSRSCTDAMRCQLYTKTIVYKAVKLLSVLSNSHT